MLRTLAATLLVVAAVAPRSHGAAAIASRRGEHRVLTVHTREFAFILPASIPAGITTFRLVNDGKEAHQISILRLAKGKTISDYAAAMKASKPAPWAVGVGGPNAAGPGQTIEATVTLDAGNYVLVCWVPSPGVPQVPHMAKGMIQALTVTATSGVAQAGVATTVASESVPDVHLELSEYTFKLSKPLTAGKHTIHVMNSGTQEHEAVLEKLASGKTTRDVDAWFESGMKGPPPFDPMPGMAGLGKGRTGTFTADFTPGRYALICYIPDAKDGKPHSMHGMVQELSVAPR